MTSSKLNEAAALAAKKAAEATAKADALTAEALQAKTAADTKAAERRKAFMTKWLAEFDDRAIDTEQRAAMAALEEAAMAATKTDPMMKASLEAHRLYFRRNADSQTSTNFASQVGVPAPASYPGANPPRVHEAMQLAVVRLAQRLEDARTADTFDALERAANGDDDG